MDNNGEMIVKTHDSPACNPRLDRKGLIIAALEDYERPLTRYALRLLGSPDRIDAARDAVQHTFLKLCEQDIEPIQNRIGPWLFHVCRNRIVDQFRSRSQNMESWPEPYQVIDQQSDPAEEAENAEFSSRLSNIIGELRGAEREVIELWSQGFDHGEISEILDKRRDTVRVILHRGITRLKKHPEVIRWLKRATSHDDPPSPHGRSNSQHANTQSQRPNLYPR